MGIKASRVSTRNLLLLLFLLLLLLLLLMLLLLLLLFLTFFHPWIGDLDRVWSGWHCQMEFSTCAMRH